AYRPFLLPDHVRSETRSYPDPRKCRSEARLCRQSSGALRVQAQRHYQEPSKGPRRLLVQKRACRFLGRCCCCQCLGAQAGSHSPTVPRFGRKSSLRSRPSPRPARAQRYLQLGSCRCGRSSLSVPCLCLTRALRY
ncbi:hypothetical protein EDD16DRAFT_1727041, partial [Pisolithus croceorrhizus]